MMRPWAFWRRVQYGTGFGVVFFGALAYFLWPYFYVAPTCFDGTRNNDERGVDCGGSCQLICRFDVQDPTVAWARSFKIVDGQYNAIAYIENRNQFAATEDLRYTLKLFDADGLITERTGTTVLPPNSLYPVFEGRILTGDRVPIRTVLELEDQQFWYPSEYSRSSFRTETFELTSADADPRLTASIFNDEFVEARNIEVVATIFDANGNALTASETFIDILPPKTRQEITFTWPEPIARTIRSCEVPTDVILGIDLSGSMNNDGATPPEPITSVLRSADLFLDRLQERDQVGIVTFASTAETAQQLTGNIARADEILNSLQISPAEETGNTNTGDAFLRAYEQFTSPLHSPNARKVFAILTDGLATAPGEPDADTATTTPESYAVEQANRLKDLGVEVYSIGLGSEVNMDFIRAIASGENRAFNALTADQVDSIYRTITAAICEDGPARIEVIPKVTSLFE